tara:strand:+ start:1598 stop:2920 length:1323 start_codon:yes stop_codon:yes gene_type:complete
MGSFFKPIKKIVKKVVKPVKKIVKKTVKAIKKVGKAVMKGVAKVSNKLGPIGMIALSMAMPYALGGLSSFTNFAMANTSQTIGGTFLRAIGTVGNSIRTGYQAFNAYATAAKQGISKAIGNAFSRFAPKGTQNFFSNISQGAKNLYNSAKQKLQSVMPKPFTAQEGTVKFYDMDGVGTMTSSQAEAAITRGTLDSSMLGEQTLSGKGGWFTKTNAAGVRADNLVTDTINDAYQNRLKNFGPNAKRMYGDIKKIAIENGTYVNDEMIGTFVESNKATSQYLTEIKNYTGDMDYSGTGTGKFDVQTEIADLAETGDYTLGTARDRLSEIQGGKPTYNFNGNETFGKQEATQGFISRNKDKLKKLTSAIGDSLLKPDLLEAEQPLEMASPIQATNFNSLYSGTDIKGSKGGELVAKVYGDVAANNIQTYYKNMNLLNSGEKYI